MGDDKGQGKDAFADDIRGKTYEHLKSVPVADQQVKDKLRRQQNKLTGTAPASDAFENEYTISIERKHEEADLGIDLMPAPKGVALRIDEVKAEGLIPQWNLNTQVHRLE